MESERFAVGLTPLPTAARVTRQRGALKWRIISTVVSLAILIAVIYFLGRDWSRNWVIAFVALWIVSTVFWFTVSIVGLQRAKRDLASIADGVAFYLDPIGIELLHPTPARARWSEVTAVKLAGRSGGAGPRLVVEAGEQRLTGVPLSFVDASAASIDSAIRSHSLGRHHLDVSALDKVF